MSVSSYVKFGWWCWSSPFSAFADLTLCCTRELKELKGLICMAIMRLAVTQLLKSSSYFFITVPCWATDALQFVFNKSSKKLLTPTGAPIAQTLRWMRIELQITKDWDQIQFHCKFELEWKDSLMYGKDEWWEKKGKKESKKPDRSRGREREMAAGSCQVLQTICSHSWCPAEKLAWLCFLQISISVVDSILSWLTEKLTHTHTHAHTLKHPPTHTLTHTSTNPNSWKLINKTKSLKSEFVPKTVN